MSNLRPTFHNLRMGFLTVLASPEMLRSSLPRGALAAIATLFLGLAISTGIGMARDYHRQSELRDSANHKRLLTLVGEVELGNAVQDFKDCLLRSDASYCDNCERHIQVLERTVSFYDTQGTLRPDERKVLAALRQALSAYVSAVMAVREMQSRHMTIGEIDAAVKGADRPIAAGLRELAALSNQRAEWHLPFAPTLGLALCTLLGALFTYLSFPISTRAATRPQGSPALLPQLSSRLFEWDEERKANAFLRLHDGVCQSLSGVMYFLKSAHLAAAVEVPESVIPSLQAAIQDTRAVALQLRPPRMEDAGLLATLHSLWVDARPLNAPPLIKSHVLLDECDIPEELKPIILRIARMTVDFAGQSPAASRVLWELARSGETLRLSIEATAETDGSRRQALSSTGGHSGFDAIQAVVVLSGGSLERVRSGDGSKIVVCSWPLSDYP
jgi:signal transduction histidine kinase